MIDPTAASVVPTTDPSTYLPAQPISGDLNDQLLQTDFWTDDMVAAAGIPIVDVPFVTIGGGIGSFVTVDYLRIAGVPTSQMRVLSTLDFPWQTYEYLTRVSQVPRPERIRSDSASRPDNIWGFPSYGFAEGVRHFNLKVLWQLFSEPIFEDYYTPKAGNVFQQLEREAKRIAYDEMLVKGLVRIVRRRYGGGYFTILTPPEGASATKRVAFRSQYVHLAVGYPGLKFLPELQRYRTENNDYRHIVNAYEAHEHVYERLVQTPSTVLVRGGGIVASRILQRLMDDREKHGAQTRIVHLFRTYIHGTNDGYGNEEDQRPGGGRTRVTMRRRGGDGWAYQGFNYPKSVWGGQLKAQVRNLEGEQRAELYKRMGGTNTPYRKSWQRQMKQGRREGWYSCVVGTVDEMRPSGERILNQVRTAQGVVPVEVDFVIDCTGLEADIAEHRLLKDLLDHGGASRNPVGRLNVDRSFELIGTQSGGGVMYASGATTLGGYFPGVDTFLGLQVAAQEIYGDLNKRGFCKRIGPVRSTLQWWKWLAGSAP
ncbi:MULTISPECIES: hypothetical protein [unclassified Nocardioides]|uniref:hypothetical protein n=1 Tax=unclassified Nocardioides TaxID=2615069 RepID=UPI0011746B4B|nr:MULTISPECIES: hypothetical protein [unclassified Nocardioides]TQK70233.1 FHA domain protein [Nocardioides sp. SLBN-35]WGY00540.1 hypothetical protein QI633_18575 [Nocardioides sp. QY071]